MGQKQARGGAQEGAEAGAEGKGGSQAGVEAGQRGASVGVVAGQRVGSAGYACCTSSPSCLPHQQLIMPWMQPHPDTQAEGAWLLLHRIDEPCRPDLLLHKPRL